ncbi:hypothetical protein ABTZ03_29665 [Kitasatospora sp. NPDC096077]|uniref:hypothetical protein n=1 Tax=Kitasatospora sp. NPDC096077 TaxID=3155544 RepID=UPI00333085CC
MAPSLKIDDPDVQNLLATLEGHIDSMMRFGAQVEDVNGEIQQHFRAACSSKYQEQIGYWQTNYQALKEAYRTFHTTFGDGHRQISNAHDQALELGSHWGGGSDEVYKGLNP